MSERDDDSTICRFCLDSEQTQKNPLLSPCNCRGSVQFIHLICLNKWRILDPGKNREICNLCSISYTIPSIYDIEKMPIRSILYYVIDSSIILSIIINYLGGILYLILPPIFTLKEAFCCIQLLIHGIQLYSMYRLFHVIKKRDYIEYWVQERRYLLVPFHGVIVLIGLYTNPVVGLVASTLCMNLYWMNHVEVLYLMNRNLDTLAE